MHAQQATGLKHKLRAKSWRTAGQADKVYLHLGTWRDPTT
jgi:hypothetical protein